MRNGTIRAAGAALASRFVFLAIGAANDYILDDYDTSSELLLRDCGSNSVHSAFESSSTSATVVWDSVYFDRIAQCGYEYEHFYAFFPGWPLLQQLLSGSSTQLRHIAALGASMLCFAASAAFLYQISCRVLQDSRKAALAVLLLCLSPASVFLTYAYTESLFLCLTFAGIWALEVLDSPMVAAAAFSMSCLVRSNGLINSGFLIYHAAKALSAEYQSKGRCKFSFPCVAHCAVGIVAMLQTTRSVLNQGYQTFCHSPAWQSANLARPFCQSTGPSLYSHIQRAYWGVGFLQYYQIKQIPNFIAAAPVLLLAAWAVGSYLAASWQRTLTLGGLGPPSLHRVVQRICTTGSSAPQPPQSKPKADTHATHEDVQSRSGARPSQASPKADTNATHKDVQSRPGARPSQASTKASKRAAAVQCSGRRAGVEWTQCDAAFVYVVHLAAMSLFAALFMHVQVATRFLTSCPALYWFAAAQMQAKLALKARVILLYCLAWAWLGLVLFPNFYPWT